MKTKMIHTIRQWIPETADLIPDLGNLDDPATAYLLLHRLADTCAEKFKLGHEGELDRVKEIIKVVNLLYINGNLYTRNAIENEFLATLSVEESPGSLKKHMELFPSELRREYIKTILEN
ncbi:hypothetical protein HX021_18580 [Sphingobacterium sp. N143]|uniref:DUF7674 family protein n=1 Tax=Sphingobacterium sp. N143 TaxID=2746727 RepID=UPI0025778A2C|nr:hypothetical protein [Sphingobacterium sp. N143]MDM1296295.1 hypothetical protein [Sphingobacterium sp. N143]